MRYNLALVLFELDHVDESERLVRSVLEDESTPPTVRAPAESLAEQIERTTAERSTACCAASMLTFDNGSGWPEARMIVSPLDTRTIMQCGNTDRTVRTTIW